MDSTPGQIIYHSRNSSDSSGYHEPSVLSDNCNASLPRRVKSELACGGNLRKMAPHSKSASSLLGKNILFALY